MLENGTRLVIAAALKNIELQLESIKAQVSAAVEHDLDGTVQINGEIASSEASDDTHSLLAIRLAEEIIARRDRRKSYFPENYFGEAAWEMMLDLFVAAACGRQVTVTSLCVASGVPASTALRWLGTLEAKGTVIRAADESDGRRVFLHLSKEAHKRLHEYFVAEVRLRGE